MCSLKKLHLVVTHFKRPCATQSTTAIHNVNADHSAGTRSPEFRIMVSALFRHLPIGILELVFGAPGGNIRYHFPMLAYLHPEVGGGTWLKRAVECLSAFIDWKAKATEQNKETGREIRVVVAGTDRHMRDQRSKLQRP
jgi:hypothetical protein